MRRNEWLRRVGILEDKQERDRRIEIAFERFILTVGPHNAAVTWRDLSTAATVKQHMEWLRERGWEATATDPYITIYLHPDTEKAGAEL